MSEVLRFVCPTCEHAYEIATADTPEGIEMWLELDVGETLCPNCLGRAVRDSRCDTCQELGIECPRGYAAERRCCDVCRHVAVMVYPDCTDDPICPRCGGTTEGEDED